MLLKIHLIILYKNKSFIFYFLSHAFDMTLFKVYLNINLVINKIEYSILFHTQFSNVNPIVLQNCLFFF